MDRTITGTITPGQSGHESNGNECVVYIHQSSRTRASPLTGLVWFGLVLWHINHCWLFNV